MLRQLSTVIALSACLAGLPVQAQTTGGTPTSNAAKPAAMVNLNTATVGELETLPGIGAKVASKIVEYRTKNGPFKKIEELMNVQGIGEKSFLKLRPQLTVAAKADASVQN